MENNNWLEADKLLKECKMKAYIIMKRIVEAIKREKEQKGERKKKHKKKTKVVGRRMRSKRRNNKNAKKKQETNGKRTQTSGKSILI